MRQAARRTLTSKLGGRQRRSALQKHRRSHQTTLRWQPSSAARLMPSTARRGALEESARVWSRAARRGRAICGSANLTATTATGAPAEQTLLRAPPALLPRPPKSRSLVFRHCLAPHEDSSRSCYLAAEL